MLSAARRYWLAVFTLVGTVIGVGIFGVPYAISRVGVVPALVFFLVLGGIQLLQHLFFAEAAIACDGPARLVGLAGKYIGQRARPVAGAAHIFGYWAAMTAYILVGGTFLHILLGPVFGGSEAVYRAAWAIIGAVIIGSGLKGVAEIELFGTAALIGVLGLIFGLTSSYVRPENLVAFDIKDAFLPYGVILFSLSGLHAVPEMEDILGGDHSRYRSSIVVGTLVSWALTLAFGLVVYGVSGAATAEDAVAGLKSVFGNGIIGLVATFGFLAVATSHFTAGLSVYHTWKMDLRLRRPLAWLLTVGPPVAVWLLGSSNFVSIISFSGAVFGGVTAILVALLYIGVVRRGAVREKRLGLPVGFAWFSIAILAVGAVISAADAVRGLF